MSVIAGLKNIPQIQTPVQTTTLLTLPMDEEYATHQYPYLLIIFLLLQMITC